MKDGGKYLKYVNFQISESDFPQTGNVHSLSTRSFKSVFQIQTAEEG